MLLSHIVEQCWLLRYLTMRHLVPSQHVEWFRFKIFLHEIQYGQLCIFLETSPTSIHNQFKGSRSAPFNPPLN